MFFSTRKARHHRLPALYDELKLPSDHQRHRRVPLLPDLAVFTECGHPVECAFDGRGLCYRCSAPPPSSADHIGWCCGRHRLGPADDVDEAVWDQARRQTRGAHRARTAYARRSLLLTTYALLKVSPADPRSPVVEWHERRSLRDRGRHSNEDRDLARRLDNRRFTAATDRYRLHRVDLDRPTPFNG